MTQLNARFCVVGRHPDGRFKGINDPDWIIKALESPWQLANSTLL